MKHYKGSENSTWNKEKAVVKSYSGNEDKKETRDKGKYWTSYYCETRLTRNSLSIGEERGKKMNTAGLNEKLRESSVLKWTKENGNMKSNEPKLFIASRRGDSRETL